LSYTIFWKEGRLGGKIKKNMGKKRNKGNYLKKNRNRMKRTAGVMAVLFGMLALTGCGSAASTNRDLSQMKVEKYVTAGDYGNISLTLEAPSVDQDQWDELLLAVYQSYVTADNGGITNRVVEEGDTVNIDYVGTKDGVAFNGGTDSGAELTIGSGRFIAGFEEGLKGVMPGETVDLDLTFPEGYDNPDLSGAAVVFTVTVNYIYPGAEEMEDAFVAGLEMEDVDTVEDLRQYVYDYLMENAESSYRYSAQNAIMEQLLAASMFEELPETFTESYRQSIRNSVEQMAAENNVTADVFTNYFYGMGSEEYVNTAAEIQAKQELVLQAIANAEGIGVEDEELDQKLEEYAGTVGYESVEALLQEFDREEYRNYFMCEKVMDFLIEHADSTE